MSLQRISCAEVPDLPQATWTQAWRMGQEVVMSGMTAHPRMQQARGQTVSVYDETLIVLDKLDALVRACGGHRHNMVKTVVYVTDIAFKEAVGQARRDFFGQHYPCSTLVAVNALVFPELRVEIDAWARLDVDLRQPQE